MESVRFISNGRYAKYGFIGVYSVAVCLGSLVASDFIWESADLSIGVMTVINIAVLLKLNSEVKRETEIYFFDSESKGKRKKRK